MTYRHKIISPHESDNKTETVDATQIESDPEVRRRIKEGERELRRALSECKDELGADVIISDPDPFLEDLSADEDPLSERESPARRPTPDETEEAERRLRIAEMVLNRRVKRGDTDQSSREIRKG